MSRFSVEGSGSHWAVRDGGRVVASASTWWRADAQADALRRKAMARVRACLTCGSKFASDGPHNRMCAACRKKSLEDGMV